MHDVLVIGGGPAGAAAAATLAVAGRDVLVLEKERFPRFHIGESLLPGMLPYLERLGVSERVERAGFVRKYAAEFVTKDGRVSERFAFADSLCGGAPYAYHVERAKFDEMLLSHAAEAGAEIRHGVHAAGFQEEAQAVAVQLRDQTGATSTARCRFLLDASGQSAFVGRQLSLRVRDPELQNLALFTQYSGVTLQEGERAGDITIVLSDEGWWWLIPLQDGVLSVGVVVPKAALAGRAPDIDYFQTEMRKCPALVERLAGASLRGELRAAVDYSYCCSQFSGARWLLAGDAAAFLDPVFSTGVLLGVSSGVEAGAALVKALDEPQGSSQVFQTYGEWLAKRLRVYSEFVKGFYRPEFVDLLLHPSGDDTVRRAVTSLLAGHADDGEVLRKIEWFLSATHANKALSLSPRLPGRREAAARLDALRSS